MEEYCITQEDGTHTHGYVSLPREKITLNITTQGIYSLIYISINQWKEVYLHHLHV